MKKSTIAQLFGLSTFCLVGTLYAIDGKNDQESDNKTNTQIIPAKEKVAAPANVSDTKPELRATFTLNNETRDDSTVALSDSEAKYPVPEISTLVTKSPVSVKAEASAVSAPKVTKIAKAKKKPKKVITEASRLNTLGFRAYRKGQFNKALPLFKQAADKDAKYMLAQYNLACTATIVLQDFPCERDDLADLAAPNTIIDALKATIALDPTRIERIKKDKDLALVRDSFRYFKEILGYSPSNMKQLKEMLVTIPWEGGSYLYHSEAQIRLNFEDNGHVTLKQAHLLEEPINDKLWTHTIKKGTYVINKGIITITLGKGADKQTYSATLSDKGILHLDSSTISSDTLPAYDLRFQWPEPCSA